MIQRDVKKSDSMAYLMTASNANEADIIESKLRMEQIPVHREEAEAGNYLKNYHGYSMYGVDLYIPIDLIDRARVVAGVDGVSEGVTDYYDERSDTWRNKYQSKRRMIGKIIVWIAIIFNLSTFAVFILQNLWNILRW